MKYLGLKGTEALAEEIKNLQKQITTLNTTITSLSERLNALTNNNSSLKIVQISQSEYNALATKDKNTIYLVTV